MKFEKVGYKQFELDYTGIFDKRVTSSVKDYLKEVYEDIKIPTRGTKDSAAYDICTPISFRLEPNETILIPSGLRVNLDSDKVFLIYPRSSTGMNGLYLLNSVGVIDSDYYSANNEGHILLGVGNRGKNTLSYSEGDRILQGIITQYFTVNNDNVKKVRTGGIGSTDK